ncbi:MAG: hypothetical protein R3Y51_03270 [Rikenellaceae bacterium]
MKRIILITFSIYGLFLFKDEKTDYQPFYLKSDTQNANFKPKNSNYFMLCDMPMRGKHLTWKHNSPTYVSHIIIKENGANIKSFIIEELSYNHWLTIYKGDTIGENCIIDIQRHLFKKLRLKVIKSEKVPHISSFQVYTRHL